MSHPSQILIVATLAMLLTRGLWRRILSVAAPLAALIVVTQMPEGAVWTYSLPGFELQLLQVDPLSRLFAIVFCMAAALGMLYGWHEEGGGERAAALGLVAGALGVVFAGDWLTLFVFWESMTVASVLLIWLGNGPRAQGAGMRYLLMHVLGGGALLAGILLHLSSGAPNTFGALTGDGLGPAQWLILLGILVNAAAPPLHTWLTDAYPECSVLGSVVQSAFTTKTAVFVLLRAFPGAEPLALWGAVMAVYGVVFAVLENDMRRLLSYHIVSQVGFMLAGIGLGSDMALNGAAAHAFCHILYKALLFMGAGALIYATGKSKLTELGGLARKMPVTMVLFIIGAVSISGFPLFNGFISKTMTIHAAELAHRGWIFKLLELASVGTFLSIGLKMTYFAFLAPGPDFKLQPLPKGMTLAMSIAAVLCLLLGVAPQLLYPLLPLRVTYHPYTIASVLGALQLHIGAALVFTLLLSILKPKNALSLDVDWFYRRPFAWLMRQIIAACKRFGNAWQGGVLNTVKALDRGDFAAAELRLPVGMTLFWASLLLVLLGLAVLSA
jgi:multicomponent Na+:H+ antiporter subunit D